MNKGNIVIYFSGVIMFSVVAVLGYFRIGEIKDAGNWPSVKGEIIESYVKKDVKQKAKGKRTETSYTPIIKYQYDVKGKIFVNSRYTMGMIDGGRKNVKRMVDQYPVGSNVEIFYNPDNPQKSTIIKATSTLVGYIMMVPLIVIILLGFVLLKKKKKPATT